MKVFLSWSGEKSREVALALREWLPAVINTIDPFVSSKDIYAGSRWGSEIAAELNDTNFGIVCVTESNQEAPWLNFEAGALAKSVESSRVVPLAVDLKVSDIKLPLGQFQAQPASEEGIAAILSSVNASCVNPLDEALLKRATAKWWPDLETELKRIAANVSETGTATTQASRSDRELLEETLNTVRSLARQLDSDGGAPPNPVAKDDPIVAELERLLEGTGTKIFHHNKNRELGLRPDASSDLPAATKAEVRELLDRHDISVIFLNARQRPPAVREVSRPPVTKKAAALMLLPV